MFIPEPVIAIAVEPKTQADVDKMGMAIAKLVEEDPTLRVKTDEDTGQTVLSGMGELHLEIIVDRMKREFKVEVNQGAPQVAYKEAFQATVEHRETLKKQTGGRGKFADIQFELGPIDAEWKDNEKAMRKDIKESAAEMLEASAEDLELKDGALAQANPRLLLLSLPAFGASGPWAGPRAASRCSA